jgi:cysteine sulfinate desulfinase/cysteine desulfurase-like protein
VLDAMLPYYTDLFGNPHSRTHAYGWESEQAVEDARKARDILCSFSNTKLLEFHSISLISLVPTQKT